MAFTGKEPIKGTDIIKNKELIVEQGHINKASISITADSQTWVGFLAKERKLAGRHRYPKNQDQRLSLIDEKVCRMFSRIINQRAHSHLDILKSGC